ncbi:MULTISPECIES: hypothetical protein [unclassified Streptomyces]|uniref:hypothetical protein n=1 Tax=unclassified Streptomyces TaxID=2593676 RepID=UPI0014894B0F|nr:MULTISPECIES: hypothetical protein [unclassified Streptomyces]
MKQPATDDLAQIRDQLREEIREARGTLKDLRYEIKTARELIESTHDLATQLCREKVEAAMKAEVTAAIDAVRKATSEQMRTSTAKVIAEFDKLRDLLLGHDRVADGREERSIPELLQDPAILTHARRAASRNHAEANRD